MKKASRGDAVRDLVFVGDEIVSGAQLGVRLLEDPRVLASASGHFAVHATDGHTHVLARDALGVAKLFYAVGADGSVETSNFFADLVQRGHAPASVSSVPSGHFLKLVPSEERLELSRWATFEFGPEGPASEKDDGLAMHAVRIRESLDRTFRRLARALSGEPLYVTLSGGLDSTTIAVLAREHLGPFTAITFAMDFEDGAEPGPGDDLTHAARIAQHLGVEHRIVRATSAELLGLLDEVLVHGQDWRDFNVHCGLVNAILARWLEERHPRAEGARRPVVLTGDAMNELVADYSPLKIGDRELYGLPKLSPGRTRRFLVQGLDAGDREVGIFARRGVFCVQPFALSAEAYVALPDHLVESATAKQELVRAVMGDRIPEHVYARPKVRAQVGSSAEVSGTLRALLEAGIDSASLERRFEELLGLEPRDRRGLVRAGFYRFATKYPKLPKNET